MAFEMPSFYVGCFPSDFNDSNEQTYQYTGVCVYTAVNTPGYGVGGTALCPPSSTTSPILGVLQNNPLLGEAGQVMVAGITKAQLGGTVSAGQLLQCNSSGQFIVATSTTYAVAQAMEGGVSNNIAGILLIRNGKQ